tara:strand:+ start:44 stop:586 length:543 start_codon:yes stop_codon:yes gene_type:complete
MPRCKKCSNKFIQYQFNNKFCKDLDCQVAKGLYLVDKQRTQKLKEINKDVRERKKALKTTTDYLKEVETVVNRFIRLRDKDKPCISCQRPLNNKFDSGHYRSKGGNPEIRFNEDNIHGQCVYCNRHLHANLIDYRISLIKRIGLERVEWLEGVHKPRKYTIPELIIMKEEYKEKIKNLTK